VHSTETSPSGLSPRVKNILVIVGALGAILVGALLIYGILVTPSRQPYRDALAQYQNVGRANAQFTAAGASLNASTASDDQFEKSIHTAQEALTSLRTENKALGKQSVLQDGEGAARYQAYDQKLQEYMTYNDELLASMQKVRPVLMRCNQDMAELTDDTKSIAALRSCAGQFTALEEVPNSDYQELVTSFGREYHDLADVFSAMAALPDPKGADAAQFRVLAAQRDEAAAQLSTISDSFRKNLQAHRRAILTTDTEKRLSDYLKSHSRVF